MKIVVVVYIIAKYFTYARKVNYSVYKNNKIELPD